MRLKILELNLDWPRDVSPLDLRQWIRNQLKKYGEPLRVAITDVNDGRQEEIFRKLKVEAVVIIP